MNKILKLISLLLVFALCLCGACAESEDEELDFSELFDEEIAADELITVDDLAMTELPEGWWNILLLGTDNRYKNGGYGRTDSMIILSINTDTQEAKLTSLMRDLWVPISGKKKTKLNAASVYGGPELTMRTINECFGMNLSDYVIINITGLADVIDLLGGLDLDVTEAERKALNKGLFDLSSRSGMEKLQHSGKNVHLNGNQAVAFARIRKIDSDYVRTQRQRYVLQRMAEKLQAYDGAAMIGIVSTLLPQVETNLSMTELMTLAGIGLKLDISTVKEFRIPADKTYQEGTFNGTWCIKADLEKNAKLLYNFIYG